MLDIVSKKETMEAWKEWSKWKAKKMILQWWSDTYFELPAAAQECIHQSERDADELI